MGRMYIVAMDDPDPDVLTMTCIVCGVLGAMPLERVAPLDDLGTLLAVCKRCSKLDDIAAILRERMGIMSFMLRGPGGVSHGPFETKDELLAFEATLNPEDGPFWIDDLTKTRKISKS